MRGQHSGWFCKTLMVIWPQDMEVLGRSCTLNDAHYDLIGNKIHCDMSVLHNASDCRGCPLVHSCLGFLWQCSVICGPKIPRAWISCLNTFPPDFYSYVIHLNDTVITLNCKRIVGATHNFTLNLNADCCWGWFTSRFQLHKRTVHSVYIIQPQKKEVLKLLLKLLTPSKFCPTTLKVTDPFICWWLNFCDNIHLVFVQKILLKEISELSNYIDKSQLPSSLGGYLIYCHQSWVSFVKVNLLTFGQCWFDMLIMNGLRFSRFEIPLVFFFFF